MRYKTYVFECAEHEDFGTLGWRLKGNSNADPLQGMAVAHDILEHAPNGDMGVEDELMALGASFYVRKYTTNMHSLGANVASDIPEVLRHAKYEGMGLRDPGRTAECLHEADIYDMFDSLAKECQYDPDLKEMLTKETKRRIRGWMRKGVRMAERRLAKADTRTLFDNIMRVADEKLKYAERGDILQVKLTFRRNLTPDYTITFTPAWEELERYYTT